MSHRSESRRAALPSAEFCCAYRSARHESWNWPPEKVLAFIKIWFEQAGNCDLKNFDSACGTLDGLTDGLMERGYRAERAC
jgi:hypothetical protein